MKFVVSYIKNQVFLDFNIKQSLFMISKKKLFFPHTELEARDPADRSPFRAYRTLRFCRAVRQIFSFEKELRFFKKLKKFEEVCF
jgi:hypothetical protein